MCKKHPATRQNFDMENYKQFSKVSLVDLLKQLDPAAKTSKLTMLNLAEAIQKLLPTDRVIERDPECEQKSAEKPEKQVKPAKPFDINTCERHTIVELKAECKSRGIKNYSKKKKEELCQMILEHERAKK
jgi:hypothetical protein